VARLMSCVFTSLLLSVSISASANLSILSVQFSPDVEIFNVGQSISVTFSTDQGVEPEYRLLLQHYSDNSWGEVLLTNWSDTDTFLISDELDGQPGGNYRLVAYARAADNPDEFMLNYQTFMLMTEGMTVCAWLDGKTLLHSGAPRRLDIALGDVFDAGDALANLEVELNMEADTLASLKFFGEVIEATLATSGRIVDWGAADFDADGPLSGSYSCEDDVVSISVATDIHTRNCGGMLGFIGCPDGHLTMSGDTVVDMSAGTLSVGGAIFRIKDSDEANAPVGAGNSSGGSSDWGMFALLSLMTLRRRFLSA
jgi:hypothetical protein